MSYLHSSIEPSQNSGSGALDIIIEHQVILLVSLQQLDGVLGLEVLKLDQSPGPPQLDGSHELINERQVLLSLHPSLLDAKVAGVLEKLLIVGPNIQHNWQYTPEK